MACERSQDLDLSAFLAAPRDEEFEDFRHHYPRCAECAAEVRAWTELHEALAPAHPDPERLAGYQALPPAERALLDRHLAGCPGCREELTQLASFDPARFTAPAPTPEPRRSWLAGLGRIFWSPAFAYGVAVLLMIPLVQRLPSKDVRAPLAEQVFPESLAVVAKRSTARVKAGAPARNRAEEAVVAELEADDLAEEKASAPAPSIRPELAANAFAAGAGRAAAVARADALSPSDVLKLESHRTARVQAPRSPLRISLPVPPEMEPGEAWLRVISADGRRELRERVKVPGNGRVEISVPGSWLALGSYRVEFEGSGSSYAFEVTQASSPRSSSRAAP